MTMIMRRRERRRRRNWSLRKEFLREYCQRKDRKKKVKTLRLLTIDVFIFDK